MPLLFQLLWFFLVILGIAFAIWVGVWVMLALVVVGVLLALWSRIRSYLVEKGILNPIPGVPMEPPSDVTVIEGEFIELESKNPTEPPKGA